MNSKILKCLECLDRVTCDDFDSWKDIALIINKELGWKG